jgi:hypothetical protein
MSLRITIIDETKAEVEADSGGSNCRNGGEMAACRAVKAMHGG